MVSGRPFGGHRALMEGAANSASFRIESLPILLLPLALICSAAKGTVAGSVHIEGKPTISSSSSSKPLLHFTSDARLAASDDRQSVPSVAADSGAHWLLGTMSVGVAGQCVRVSVRSVACCCWGAGATSAGEVSSGSSRCK